MLSIDFDEHFGIHLAPEAALCIGGLTLDPLCAGFAASSQSAGNGHRLKLLAPLLSPFGCLPFLV